MYENNTGIDGKVKDIIGAAKVEILDLAFAVTDLIKDPNGLGADVDIELKPVANTCLADATCKSMMINILADFENRLASKPELADYMMGKGERGFTSSPYGTDNPFKHFKPDPNAPSKIIFKSPDTGKKILKQKPPGFDDWWNSKKGYQYA